VTRMAGTRDVSSGAGVPLPSSGHAECRLRAGHVRRALLDHGLVPLGHSRPHPVLAGNAIGPGYDFGL
jgi:hypothetical protein